MKKLGIVFAVVAVFAAAAAVVVGNLRARDIHSEILNAASLDPRMQVSEPSFSPGLLGANSVMTFVLGSESEAAAAAEAGQPEVAFRLENEIQHGAVPVLGWLASGAGGTPVIAQVKTRLSLAGDVEAPLREVLGELPSLEIETTLRSSGVGESHFHVEPLQASGESPAGEFNVDWKGLDGRIVYTSDFGKLVGKLDSAGLEFTSSLAEMQVGSFGWTVDFDTDPSGLHVGTAGARVDAFALQPILVPMPSVRLEKLTLNQVSRVEGGRYSVDLTNRFESLDAGGSSWGPGVLNFALRNLDAVALVAAAQTAQQVQERLQAGEEGDALQAEVGQKMIEALPALAAHSPQFELSEITLTTPEGTVRGKAELSLDGSDPQQLQNPMFMLGALSAKASAEAPAELFASIVEHWASGQVESGEVSMVGDFEETVAYIRDNLIQNLRKAGYVVFDGEHFRTRIDWSQGRLTINGMPVDPTQLGMLASGGGAGLGFPSDGGPGVNQDGFDVPASLAR